jgi:hypothetical protein
VYSEVTGVFVVAIGVYTLARPSSVRSFPAARQWETDPERARQEQRAYAALLGFSAVLGGIALVVLGLLGRMP